MIQRIVPRAVGFSAVGKGAGVEFLSQKEPGDDEKHLHRHRRAGGNGGAEMEKGDDIREYQLQYVNGIDAFFHGISLANSDYFQFIGFSWKCQ